MCLHQSCELHDGKQTKPTALGYRCSQVYSSTWSWKPEAPEPDCCLTHQPYIALVSWELPCLQTRPDAWLHGTDTAPSGSSPPPRRGRRTLGVLTAATTGSQEPAASGRTAWTLHFFFYLCGLGEDELRVFHQTLQRHRHINDLRPLVLPTVVRHELAVPGVEDDEAWFYEAAADSANQVKPNILLCYFNVFQKAHQFLIGPKQFHYAEFIHSYIKKKGLHY